MTRPRKRTRISLLLPLVGCLLGAAGLARASLDFPELVIPDLPLPKELRAGSAAQPFDILPDRLAVVADDHEMELTLLIDGRETLKLSGPPSWAATPKQMPSFVAEEMNTVIARAKSLLRKVRVHVNPHGLYAAGSAHGKGSYFALSDEPIYPPLFLLQRLKESVPRQSCK